MAESIQMSSAKLASEMEDRSQTLVQLGETEPHEDSWTALSPHF